jgi:hypothetical protein
LLLLLLLSVLLTPILTCCCPSWTPRLHRCDSSPCGSSNELMIVYTMVFEMLNTV